jgi:nicotinamide mononucleotide transporter
LLVSIYGIIYWNKKNSKQVQIGKAHQKDFLYAAGIFVACYAALFMLFIIREAPIEVVNYGDMYVTAMAFAGTFLLVKRKIENWILLNLSNIVAIPVQIHKELYLIAILTGIFFVLAVLGYLRWRRLINSYKTI